MEPAADAEAVRVKEGAATTREAEEGAAATTAPSAELERRQPNAVQPRRRPRDRGPTLLDARVIYNHDIYKPEWNRSYKP